jgi:pimeloyl-ACP methyl ester carboxylesterase
MPDAMYSTSRCSRAGSVKSSNGSHRARTSQGWPPACSVRALERLAGPALAQVRAPTLLIVGGADPEVLVLNREAARHMRCLHALRVVPGATHLFEEPGTLESVATLAADWFTLHLTEPSHA